MQHKSSGANAGLCLLARSKCTVSRSALWRLALGGPRLLSRRRRWRGPPVVPRQAYATSASSCTPRHLNPLRTANETRSSFRGERDISSTSDASAAPRHGLTCSTSSRSRATAEAAPAVARAARCHGMPLQMARTRASDAVVQPVETSAGTRREGAGGSCADDDQVRVGKYRRFLPTLVRPQPV
jgi:hypothetical protein